MRQGRAEKVHLFAAALAPFEHDAVTSAAMHLPCQILLCASAPIGTVALTP
jgi:hypothetical protein